MNKAAIKNFATTARRKLLEAVEHRAYELGITRTEIIEPEVYQEGFRINQRFYRKYEIKQRNELLKKIKEKGFDQVIEEVSYTWFNRFIAIRFMEVNDYLPTGVRIFSSIIEDKTEPDALTEVDMIADELGLDMEIVYRLQDENDTEDLFRYILVKQCNQLGELMPLIFEKIQDYTELLLPDGLLLEESIVKDLVRIIDEDSWNNQVEIIGWLYQEYISERKELIDKYIKSGKKVSKEDIPAKTQLFTPKWIVNYMIENSLGKIFSRNGSNTNLIKDMESFINNESIYNNRDIVNPEEIKILDPCVGSGHILVSAFDLLFLIYQEAGYSTKDIPKLILEKNLFGLEVDNRAIQIAYFALFMKARSYYSGVFNDKINLNLYAIQESNGINQDISNYLKDKLKNGDEVNYLLDKFKDAKQFGSLIEVEKDINFDLWIDTIKQLDDNEAEDIFTVANIDNVKETFLPLIYQAKLLSQKYDVVVTNPPYLGRRNMDDYLKNFIDKQYPNSKMELYAVFIEACYNFCKENSYVSMVTRDSWMFTGSFKDLRMGIVNNAEIDTMLHLGSHAFEEIQGEVVTTTAFSLKKNKSDNTYGIYYRLVDKKNSDEKEQHFKNNKLDNIKFNQENFKSIIGWPLCYWIKEEDRDCFINNNTLLQVAPPKKGLDSNGDSQLYFRKWYEVEKSKIYLNHLEESSKYTWFEIDMGGDFRKWYGNRSEIINYENNGYSLKHKKKKANIRNENLYFKKSLTYGVISSQNVSFRESYENALFYQHGANCFPSEEMFYYILAFGNSKVANRLLTYIAPTLTFTVGDVAKLPIQQLDAQTNKTIINLVKENIRISKNEWDSFETSWDFKKHPLILKNNNSIKKAYDQWNITTEEWFNTLKENEEKLNDIFNKLYNLENKVDAKMKDRDITIRLADTKRDIKSLLSYAVGCMFGRYSLDVEGTVFTGGNFDPNQYTTYKVATDNIIPITDDEYFENDIVSKFIEFISTVFGEDTLEENIDFIAESLIKRNNEPSRKRIRRYFFKEFFKDHVQTYQKRPIYWMFDSGKNDGFKALVYMHRYEPRLVASVRTDYLHTLIKKYEEELDRIDYILESNVSATDKKNAKKQKENLQKQLLECQQYDQVIGHVANRRIEINLDDGVSINYAKFQGVEIPQGEGKKPLKTNLLANL